MTNSRELNKKQNNKKNHGLINHYQFPIYNPL